MVGSIGTRRLAQRRALAPVAHVARGGFEAKAVAIDRARRCEEALLARDVAERCATTRDELLAVVAHDLVNPLHAVSLWAKLVLDAAPSGAAGETVRTGALIIRAAADRMNMLVHDLRDVACIDTGHLGIRKEEADVKAIVTTAIDALLPLCVEKDLTIRGTAPALRLSCDPNRLQQVLGNLVANAIKFTPRGGAITLDAELTDGAIRFGVADTGPGVSEEARAHVFERYWRGRERDASAGVGLGLFISKGIVDAHGGRIWVESAVGGGSAFRFTIPLS